MFDDKGKSLDEASADSVSTGLPMPIAARDMKQQLLDAVRDVQSRGTSWDAAVRRVATAVKADATWRDAVIDWVFLSFIRVLVRSSASAERLKVMRAALPAKGESGERRARHGKAADVAHERSQIFNYPLANNLRLGDAKWADLDEAAQMRAKLASSNAREGRWLAAVRDALGDDRESKVRDRLTAEAVTALRTTAEAS